MTVDLIPAFVLHRRRYRESSLLLDVLSRDSGRVVLIAKGAAGARSRRNALLTPFNPILINWRGRGEVPVLANVEQAEFHTALHGDATICGLYANELLVRLTARDDPHPELFAIYLDLLAQLSTTTQVEPALRFFEKRLLEAIGYGLQLTHEAYGDVAIVARERYVYDIEHGPVPAVTGNRDNHSIAGATLLALAEEGALTDSMKRESKQLMRRVLDHHLGGRALLSRSLFGSLKRV